jgi:hypothetical protein
MPTDRFTTDSSHPPLSDLAAEHAGQGVDGDEAPILEEADLFVPDPAWTIEQPSQVLAELHSLVLSGSACLLRPCGHPELVAHPVAVDEAAGRIVWRLSGSLPNRVGLLEVGSASVEATIGRIDLLFQCAVFRPMGDDIALLSSTLPPSIRRIQRREAYRLRMRAYSRGGPHVQLRPPQALEPLRIRILV